jgi:hypothetical protein
VPTKDTAAETRFSRCSFTMKMKVNYQDKELSRRQIARPGLHCLLAALKKQLLADQSVGQFPPLDDLSVLGEDLACKKYRTDKVSQKNQNWLTEHNVISFIPCRSKMSAQAIVSYIVILP